MGMAGSVWPGRDATGILSVMGDVYGSTKVRVYCRTPECCPQFRDEDRLPLAATAEAAGMRACKDCRPYRLPQTLAHHGGAPGLVCRAVRLIVDGALDEGNEASLAARLGVSPRHLRRMFTRHVGVTPDGLARSCRAHFAHRLLDDTVLSVTEVAFAAGYGSTRQFNREFKRIFRGTPSQQRADGRFSPGRLGADGGLALRLWFTGPLDWEAMTAFLAARAVPGVEYVDRSVYRRTIMVDGEPGAVELSPGDGDYLSFRVHLPRWETLMHVAARARKIAGLDEDPAGSPRPLAADPVIGPLVAARPGVRVPGCWDPFEVGVAAIVEQQAAPPASRPVMERLVTGLGRRIPGPGPLHLSHIFPAPDVLARAGTALQAIGLTGGQAETVMAFASAVGQGLIRLDGSMASEQLIGSIAAVPGMTASTAEYIALRAGEPDAFPADDPALRQSLRQLAGTPGPPPGHGWEQRRSYVAAHLWAASLRSFPDQPGLRSAPAVAGASRP
jgi:AraC family transcriptional regulator, regulatory protein of adaptative response / DNA-3-methyladenine glycosylase II